MGEACTSCKLKPALGTRTRTLYQCERSLNVNGHYWNRPTRIPVFTGTRMQVPGLVLVPMWMHPYTVTVSSCVHSCDSSHTAHTVEILTRSQAVAMSSRPYRLIGGHATSSVMWLFDSPYAIFLLVVLWNQASISNGFRDIQRRMSRNGWHDLDTTSKRRSRSFYLVPIDFAYTTSYISSQ